MMANFITLARMPLLGGIILLLYQPSAKLQLVAAPLIIVLILMDSLDGIVARRRGESSLLGSVLDIAADRAVELLLWVVFADLDMLPVVIPLLVLARGIFVDAIRAVAPARGLKPFELLHSSVARFLVGSPWLRSPYGVAKAVAFFLLALAYGLTTAGRPTADLVRWWAQVFAWLAFAFCLLRGLPVLIEAPRILSAQQD